MPVGKQQLFGYYLDEGGNKKIIELKATPDGNLETSLNGSLATIGAVTYAVSGGDTLRNTAANKPTAAAAHAVIPFCYYFAVDTGAIEVTDGTNWTVI